MARYHLLPDLKPLAPTQVHRLLPKSPSVLRRNLFLTPFSFYGKHIQSAERAAGVTGVRRDGDEIEEGKGNVEKHA
ncbi:hypothetical protein FNV43_RR10579 [Rhamnella rubrinervis]|uniref:Uncharacterized protein n=1 Tax=Rhamnella rubrinervis TaxID=2594499 RepID=A0A8K0MH26_9ROSA|nr:hypothetical protein FNV43_RR10579 [Rhamnella rubrinervis]